MKPMKNLLILTILFVVNLSYSQTQPQVDVQKRIKDTRDVCESMKEELNRLKIERSNLPDCTMGSSGCQSNLTKLSEVYLKGLSDYLKYCGGK